jgi:hypothetical protein
LFGGTAVALGNERNERNERNEPGSNETMPAGKDIPKKEKLI